VLDGPSSPSARRVQAVLDGFGLGLRVVEFEQPTRTSAEAANAIGCTVAQIAKSLIFRTVPGGRPVLVVASGTNRVNEKAVPGRFVDALAGERIGRADADFVRTSTGFAIGGVAPVGHAVAPVVLIDADLLQYDEIWAAAGTPNAVFRLTPSQLVEMTKGTVGPVA
jgi:prolyl-tRNA editing enzyme YbaK/EbsC (Cys-tRNA(Pro) deacylase)